MDTLEHVEFPFKAVEQVFRVLKPGGTLVMSSVTNFPIHDYPFDYWRFTPEAFRSLLKNFSSRFVDQVGVENFPHTVVVGVGVKDGIIVDEFLRRERLWKKTWSKQYEVALNGWRELVNPFVPPVILKLKKALV